MLKGLDISKWQGDVNWSSLAKNQDFVIIRSSYGSGYTDEKFARNRDGARKEGVPHGFYHYSYPQYNSPEAEADWFLNVVSPLQEGESLYLDFEEKYPDPVGWSVRFLERLSSKLEGYKPLIYLNKFTVQSYDWKPISSKGYGLWLAYWDYDPNGTFDVSHWNLVAMRQYSNNEVVNGISGRVDGNVFYGGIDQFYAYGVKIGDIPCEKLKLENQQLLLDIQSLKKQNQELQNSLNGLNELYKKLLAEDEIEDEEMAQLVKDYGELGKQLKIESDKVFEKDIQLQEIKEKNDILLAENSRLKQQNFTIVESIVFLINAIKGGGSS